MKKITLLLFLLGSLAFSGFSQVIDLGIPVQDNQQKYTPELNSSKRSATAPKACRVDTVEFPRYRASSLVTISISNGRSLGQLYSCPKPLSVRGFTFYSFITPNKPTGAKMEIICNLYKAGPDSLPSGLPLRSDTIYIDSTFGNGQLNKIEKHASWQPITLDSNYIITVETTDDTLVAGVVTTSYRDGDGERYNLNCGSISGLWYNGLNLNVGGITFDADILLHPHVKYDFGTDFQINSNCYNLKDTVKFNNLSYSNFAGSRMYNRYLNFSGISYEYLCHRWNMGLGGFQYNVNNQIKYSNKQNYQITLISTVYGFRGNNGGCIDTTIKQLYFKPDAPGISGSLNICFGDTLKLKASSQDFGVDFNWYDAQFPNTIIETGVDFVKGPVTVSDTFLLRADNNGCVSNARTLMLNATAYPQTLQVLNDSVCAGSKANLKASSDIGNLRWFTSPTGGIPIHSGPIYQTPVLNADTSFYVEAINGQCILKPRVKVEALVGSDFAPVPPILSNDTTVCLSATGSLNFTATPGSGLSVRWFSAASGGTPITLGSTYNYVPYKREVITFYADAFNGVCGSTREGVTLTVEDYPTISTVFSDTICLGDSSTLGIILPFGEANWFDASTGGNLVTSGENYKYLPKSNTTFYIQGVSGNCVNPNLKEVSTQVNTFPEFSKLWGDTICSKNQATLYASLAAPGTITWFETDTGKVALSTGNSYMTQVLNGSKKYFASTEYMGCVGPRYEVQPLVKPSPFSGFSFEILTWQQVRVAPINSAGSRVFWDLGDGNTSTLNSVTHRYDNPGLYDVKLVLTSISNACKDSTIIPINIEVSSLKNLQSLPQLNLYPNPGSDKVNIQLGNLNKADIKVYNMQGVEVMNHVIEDHTGLIVLDVSDLAGGNYILHVEGYMPLVFVVQ